MRSRANFTLHQDSNLATTAQYADAEGAHSRLSVTEAVSRICQVRVLPETARRLYPIKRSKFTYHKVIIGVLLIESYEALADPKELWFQPEKFDGEVEKVRILGTDSRGMIDWHQRVDSFDLKMSMSACKNRDRTYQNSSMDNFRMIGQNQPLMTFVILGRFINAFEDGFKLGLALKKGP